MKKVITLFIILCFVLYSDRLFSQVQGWEYLGQTPPGDTPRIFAPGIISGYIHGRIAISPEGDEIYWVINPSTERIYYSKIENGIWSKPEVTDFVKDYLTVNNGGIVFSPEGKKLFFYSDRPGGMGNLDTWYVEKNGSAWSKPINSGAPYNSAGNDQVPIFTKNGNAYRIGFTDKEESLCFKYSGGGFFDPVHMETNPEYSPWWSIFISPEESYLIFAAGSNDADLYIRFRNTQGDWGNPINMGDKINTKEWERFPVVSPDGKYLFFTRGGASINTLYWVSTVIIDSIRKSMTGIEKNNAQKMPVGINLYQNYPNPFNPTTIINYKISKASYVNIKVFDVFGREVAVLVNEIKQAGKYSVNFDAGNLSTGTYFYRINTESYADVKKMTLIR